MPRLAVPLGDISAGPDGIAGPPPVAWQPPNANAPTAIKTRPLVFHIVFALDIR
jgi:hypothetical protein